MELPEMQSASPHNSCGDCICSSSASPEGSPIVHGAHFLFAWAAFQPDTRIYQG